jgi:hypothetical protein
MSISRSGTPFQAHNATAATTAAVTVPSTASVGALGLIVAVWSTNGSWGATPGGWTVVPNSTQTTSSPACIAYYKILVATDLGANVTVTGPASAVNSVCAFAYTGSQGFDANASQRNASSTTCTAPALTAAGAADLLVMVGGASSGAITFSAPTNSLSLWQATAGTGTGIADSQLAASGSTGSSAMTISAASANAGLQFTLFQLDADGEGPTSSGARRVSMRGWSRATQLTATGPDEPLFVGPIADEFPATLARPLRRFRPSGAGPDDGALPGLVFDQDNSRPATRRFTRLRRGRPSDEQQPPVAPPPDENAAPRRARLVRLRNPVAAASPEKLAANTPRDESFAPRAHKWARFRRWIGSLAEDLGITVISTEPSCHFAASLDRSLNFAAATLNPTIVFGATLTPPLIFGATLG